VLPALLARIPACVPVENISTAYACCSLPGTHIPIHHPGVIVETRPDSIQMLPWNLRSEIVEHLSYVSEWGARFIVPIPYPQIRASQQDNGHPAEGAEP
jgi:hypothetical protein